MIVLIGSREGCHCPALESGVRSVADASPLRGTHDEQAFTGVHRRRQRIGARVAAGPRANTAATTCRRSRRRRSSSPPPAVNDELPDSRRRITRHERPGPAKELLRRGRNIPVVFITAQGDRSLRRASSAAGAVACLLKPFSDTALLEASTGRLWEVSMMPRDGCTRRHPRSYTVSPSTRRRNEVVTMPDPTAIVFVVDDDVSVRESLELLIKNAGWQPETFASALEFLSRPRAAVPCCLVLDVTLPGLNGLELQQQLTERTEMPIIFITGYGDVPMSVRAMKAGAIEFLTKPFKDEVLLDAIRQRHRAQPRRAARGVGDAGASQPLRLAHAARTRGDGAGRQRVVEQAGRRRARHQRDHGEGASRPADAQDAGRLASRSRHDGGEARRANGAGLTAASSKRNHHCDGRAASRRGVELERAVQLTRAFAHRDQSQPA